VHSYTDNFYTDVNIGWYWNVFRIALNFTQIQFMHIV